MAKFVEVAERRLTMQLLEIGARAPTCSPLLTVPLLGVPALWWAVTPVITPLQPQIVAMQVELGCHDWVVCGSFGGGFVANGRLFHR